MSKDKKKIKLKELTRMVATHVSVVDRGANWGGQRHFFELKADDSPQGNGPGGPGMGPGGECVCPECGAKKAHETGQACSEIKCPKCGAAMTRGKNDDMAKPEGGRKPAGKPGTWAYQSIIFNKDKFTLEQARTWLGNHEEFGDHGLDETDTSYRFRQYDPAYFDKFKNDALTDGITGVYARIKMSKSVPAADATLEEKQAATEARSKQYGIEVTESTSFVFPDGGPTTESLYGDPVNMTLQLGNAENVRDKAAIEAALKAFRESADTYTEDTSKARVYERIVRAALAEDIEVKYDPEDDIDKLLPGDIKARLAKTSDGDPGQDNTSDDSTADPVDWMDQMKGKLDMLGMATRMQALKGAAEADQTAEVAKVEKKAKAELANLRKRAEDAESDLVLVRKQLDEAKAGNGVLIAERDAALAQLKQKKAELGQLKGRIGTSVALRPNAAPVVKRQETWKEDYGDPN